MHRLEADGAEVGAGAILEVCRDHDLDCPDLVLVELVLVGEGRCGQESHQGGQLGPGASAAVVAVDHGELVLHEVA